MEPVVEGAATKPFYEITEILSQMNRTFEIMQVKWNDGDKQHFEAKFRSQVPRDIGDDYNAQCDDWVQGFSAATDTVWVNKISNTGPKVVFRKQYQCWPHRTREVRKELLFDARRCSGTLDIKVLKDDEQSRRKSKHLRMGLNAVVKIDFYHLHPVDVNANRAFFVHTCDPQPGDPPNVSNFEPVVKKGPKRPRKKAARGRNVAAAAARLAASGATTGGGLLQPCQPQPGSGEQGEGTASGMRHDHSQPHMVPESLLMTYQPAAMMYVAPYMQYVSNVSSDNGQYS